MVLTFYAIFNSSATYVHNVAPYTETIAIDASLESVGGVWNNEIYSHNIPSFMKKISVLHAMKW